MASQAFNAPGSRNTLDTKVAVPVNSKSTGAGYNKGQINGGTGKTTDGGGTKSSTGAGQNKGQIRGGSNGKGAIPGFSGNSTINGKI